MKSFDELNVTTMTLILTLNGLINVDAVFLLLPITRLELPPAKRRTQKFKIPFCEIPGSILSMRYRGNTRGIVRSSSTTHFKNSITIDISTIHKNVSVKLSTAGFHICGATSVEQGRESAQYIIDYVTQIQGVIDQINADEIIAQSTLEWVKQEIKGKATISILPDPGSGCFRSRLVHRINRSIDLTKAPNPTIAQLLLRQTMDYLYVEDVAPELDWVLTLKSIATPGLSIRSAKKAMVNYNYDLGFAVNRPVLARMIDGMNGFHARYNNAIEHSVTVELPYEPRQQDPTDDVDPITGLRNPEKGRRKNKNPRHTFLVYRSGLVTQSGPDDEMMREPYELFIHTIESLRPHIVKDDTQQPGAEVPTGDITPPEAPLPEAFKMMGLGWQQVGLHDEWRQSQDTFVQQHRQWADEGTLEQHLDDLGETPEDHWGYEE